MVRTSESFPSTESDGGKASLGGTRFCQQAPQEWFALAKTEQGLKLTLGVLQAVPKEEVDPHHIQHAQRSSQLEHAVLENGAR